MTRLQQQKREVKALAEKLEQHHTKLQKRIEAYDREKRQLSIIQQNIQNIRNISKELLDSIEEIELRKRGN